MAERSQVCPVRAATNRPRVPAAPRLFGWGTSIARAVSGGPAVGCPRASTAHALRAAPRLGGSRASTAHAPRAAPRLGDSRASIAHAPRAAGAVGRFAGVQPPIGRRFFRVCGVDLPGRGESPGCRVEPCARRGIHQPGTGESPAQFSLAPRLVSSPPLTAHPLLAASRLGSSPPQPAQQICINNQSCRARHPFPFPRPPSKLASTTKVAGRDTPFLFRARASAHPLRTGSALRIS